MFFFFLFFVLFFFFLFLFLFFCFVFLRSLAHPGLSEGLEQAKLTIAHRKVSVLQRRSKGLQPIIFLCILKPKVEKIVPKKGSANREQCENKSDWARIYSRTRLNF